MSWVLKRAGLGQGRREREDGLGSIQGKTDQPASPGDYLAQRLREDKLQKRDMKIPAA